MTTAVALLAAVALGAALTVAWSMWSTMREMEA